jgi:6-pyruvoyltetrahydropterin/6-carboxytetrahydropterin synthase
VSWDLIVRQKFSAAHFLEHYKGKCERMHGHTFTVEAHFKADKLDRSGIAIDFTGLRDHLKSILPDHEVLNEALEFSPSAENLAKYFYEKLRETHPVSRVVVWESEDAGAAYPG